MVQLWASASLPWVWETMPDKVGLGLGLTLVTHKPAGGGARLKPRQIRKAGTHGARAH